MTANLDGRRRVPSRMRFLLILLVVSLAHAQPNMVIILADDLGWADVRCNDPLERAFYETPAIDALANLGVRFTNAYANGPNCAPSRAALLTGLIYPNQPIYTVGSGARGRAENRKLEPVDNETVLPLSHVTLAERLKQAGYATGFVGKWHQGAPPEHGPTAQGFDVNVGGCELGHPPSYFSAYEISALADGPEGEYLTDRLADEACNFIEAHADGPFFLLYAPYAVHTPLSAPAHRIDRTRMPDRGHKNATYAAMIRSLDDAVARVIATLERHDRIKDTIIVFTSDNGGVGGYEAAGVEGARDITDQSPLRGGKGMLYEGGIRVPLIISWPGRGRRVVDEPVTLADLVPTLCGAAGIDVPDLDGVDITPLLDGESIQERTLVWHFPGYLEANVREGTWRTTPVTALRRGRYKLIEFYETGRVEVYDLVEDPGETRDLSQVEGRASTMRSLMLAWRAEVSAPMAREK